MHLIIAGFSQRCRALSGNRAGATGSRFEQMLGAQHGCSQPVTGLGIRNSGNTVANATSSKPVPMPSASTSRASDIRRCPHVSAVSQASFSTHTWNWAKRSIADNGALPATSGRSVLKYWRAIISRAMWALVRSSGCMTGNVASRASPAGCSISMACRSAVEMSAPLIGCRPVKSSTIAVCTARTSAADNVCVPAAARSGVRRKKRL